MAIDKPLMSVCRKRSQTHLLSIIRDDNVDIIQMDGANDIFQSGQWNIQCREIATTKIKTDLLFTYHPIDYGLRSHLIWILFGVP